MLNTCYDSGMESLQRSILRTIVLFDVVGMPATALEVFRYLVRPGGFADRAEMHAQTGDAEPLPYSYGDVMWLLQEDSGLARHVEE